MSWAKMSWPSIVVPSRCSREGCRLDGNAQHALESRTEVNQCGKAARTQNTRKMTRPAVALGLRRIAVHMRRPARRVSIGVSGAWMVSVVTVSSLRPGAWVEPRDRDVTGEHGNQHGDRIEQQQHLHERVVR